MVSLNNHIGFNPKKPKIMHLDVNSCFATIEQQANPLLRGKPVGIAARETVNGCILAASIEAKKIGIKTGFTISEAKQLCPDIIIIRADPDKYRSVHRSLRKILSSYTPKIEPKSIDEFVLNFDNCPYSQTDPTVISQEIKKRIRKETGEWISVSIGWGPNRFLAKTGAGIIKPDGLVIIDISNFLEVYSRLNLKDLNGINVKNEIRLNNSGIFSVISFYKADISSLRSAFRSVLANYWYIKLRGWEIDDFESKRTTFGQSYVFPKPKLHPLEIYPVIQKLVEKMGYRMRVECYKARCLHISLLFQTDNRDKLYWHKGITLKYYIFDSYDIYSNLKLLTNACALLGKYKVCFIAVNCYEVIKDQTVQLEIFDDIFRKKSRVNSIDTINKKWGSYRIGPARMIHTQNDAPDAIAFGQIERY
jgi:DNA polymerase IV